MDPIEVAKALIRRFEGCYRGPYLCPAGVPTIGYGATYYEDGTRVTLHDPIITVERAEQLLLWHVENVYLPAVIQLCPGAKEPGMVAALIDWTFNLGGSQLRGSTLRKRVNQGDLEGARVELMKWVYAAGKRLRGLVARRAAEAALF